jgi:Asp-tRNA(Asn)/Glu-tRNA(Gln) amidotransferase A subunit family amidase
VNDDETEPGQDAHIAQRLPDSSGQRLREIVIGGARIGRPGADHDGRIRSDDLQPAVRTRLALGFKISAHDFLQALRLRVHLSRNFLKDVFPRFDVRVTPVIMEPHHGGECEESRP